MTLLMKSTSKTRDLQPSPNTLLHTSSQSSIAILRPSDLSLGPELGRGGFCAVREIHESRIPLRRPSASDKTSDILTPTFTDLSSSPTAKSKSVFRKIKHKLNRNNSKSNDHAAACSQPQISSSHPEKNTDDDSELSSNPPSFVIKLLRNDLSSRARSRGRLDICIEAAHLLNIKHQNIIRVVAISRGVAKYLCQDPRWKNETDFFLVLEKLEYTMEDVLRQWADEVRHAKRKKKSKESFLSLAGLKVTGLWSNRKKRKEEKRLWVKRLTVARDIARAVGYLHENRTVYRDLKPSNIGVSYGGVTTIFDFGLAKTLSPEDKLCNSLYRMTGHTGSLRYMAPEVALDLPYNTTVDSYSFAMLLWQTCSLVAPFLGFTREKHEELVIRRGWRPAVGKRWPKGCIEIIDRCWSDNISKRMDFKEIEEVLTREISRLSGGGGARRIL